MTDVLLWLLVLSIITSALLIVVASAAAGRGLTDLEHQKVSGINGIRRIQAWRNVRTQLNRLLLAIGFIVISLMLVGNAPEPWRMWVNRLLFVFIPLDFLVSSMLDWYDDDRQLYMLMEEKDTTAENDQ